MTDYDRPAGAYGGEPTPDQPADELIVGRPGDQEAFDREEAPGDEEALGREEAPRDPETFDREEPPRDPETFETTDNTEAAEAAPEEGSGPAAESEARPGAHAAGGADAFEPVFGTDHAGDVRQRWRDIQASFVDDPHDSIGRAGKLTDEVLSTLTSGLENRRRALEEGVAEGDTEQLRIALRQYRMMLDHVLAL